MLSLTRADKLAISNAAEQAARKLGRPSQVKLRAGKNTYDVEYHLGDSKDHRTLAIRGGKKLALEDVNDVLTRFGFRSKLDSLSDQEREGLCVEVSGSAATITEFLNGQKPTA